MTDAAPDTEVWIPGAEAQARRALDVDGLVRSATLVGDIDVPLEIIGGDGVIELLVDRSRATGRLAIELVADGAGGTASWSPDGAGSLGRLPPSWASPRRVSPLHGLGLRALLGSGDQVLLTVAASAGTAALDVRAGGVEETGHYFVSVAIEPGHEPLRVRVSSRREPFGTAIGLAVDWLWGDTPAASSSPTSRRPVFCTWYSMHLGVTQAEILRQLDLIDDLGFGSVIIDDGWQTDEVRRGYASAGDWTPSTRKFPDPAGLMTALHERGVAGIWWVGTPFAGDRSALAASGVPLTRRLDELETSVLDARSRSSREALERRLTDLVGSTGADGLKVDFLEQFADDGGAPAPSDADVATGEQGAIRVLAGLRSALSELVDEPLIEYRQPYVGPEATSLATMIRVGDCPQSDVDNRVGIVELRLTTRHIAVHADPIMWAPDAAPERIARSLVHALFGVPQISVDLVAQSPRQLAALRFWLDFWSENADVLLDGDLVAERPDLRYPVVTATAGDRAIAGRYAPLPIEWPGDRVTTLSIANADESEVLVRSAPGPLALVVRSAEGEIVEQTTIARPDALLAVAVPLGGLLELRSDA